MIGARAAEMEAVVQRLCSWAGTRQDVRGLLLVGSWASDAAHAESDLDVMLLTLSAGRYVDDDRWIAEIGDWRLVRTQAWGVVTERRLANPSGFELELNVASPSWASTDPLDAGTRRVVADGARILLDRDGALAALLEACGTALR
jgi:uncharacterized protein